MIGAGIGVGIGSVNVVVGVKFRWRSDCLERETVTRAAMRVWEALRGASI